MAFKTIVKSGKRRNEPFELRAKKDDAIDELEDEHSFLVNNASELDSDDDVDLITSRADKMFQTAQDSINESGDEGEVLQVEKETERKFQHIDNAVSKRRGSFELNEDDTPEDVQEEKKDGV